ncbi:MAG: hypothetical protein PVI86_19330 [Phycisphaerae bacterium]|jgi:hypothetical protein
MTMTDLTTNPASELAKDPTRVLDELQGHEVIIIGVVFVWLAFMTLQFLKDGVPSWKQVSDRIHDKLFLFGHVEGMRPHSGHVAGSASGLLHTSAVQSRNHNSRIISLFKQWLVMAPLFVISDVFLSVLIVSAAFALVVLFGLREPELWKVPVLTVGIVDLSVVLCRHLASRRAAWVEHLESNSGSLRSSLGTVYDVQ